MQDNIWPVEDEAYVEADAIATQAFFAQSLGPQADEYATDLLSIWDLDGDKRMTKHEDIEEADVSNLLEYFGLASAN